MLIHVDHEPLCLFGSNFLALLTRLQSSPAIRRANQKFAGNVEKRGLITAERVCLQSSLLCSALTLLLQEKKQKDQLPVGPVVLGLFIFIVIGSGMMFFSLFELA